VGCVNGCSFCCTSHFFGKSYSPFLGTGKEIFDTCCRLADERGTDEFFVMDENFLKDRQRAMELLEEMERAGRYFTFQIFSSAEAIRAFGVDNMVRLGVMFVWIGVESCSGRGNFEKNRGIDPKELVQELREKGIIVLASGILCQEHHTPENIEEDIDFMVDLEADFVQFMLLTPLPVTGLYKSQKRRGLLREDLPLEEWHGQKHLSFKHPAFPGDSAEKWIGYAFRKDYLVNSSSMYRVVETCYRGYTRLDAMERDACLEARKRALEKRIRVWSCMLPALVRHPVSSREKWRALSLDQRIRTAIPPTRFEKLGRMATPACASAWKLRMKLKGDMIQPRTILTRYHGERRGLARPVAPVVRLEPRKTAGVDAAAASMVESLPL
jgi:radical SAM superfamily enzyme YgiQ (UPF0313 family)